MTKSQGDAKPDLDQAVDEAIQAKMQGGAIRKPKRRSPKKIPKIEEALEKKCRVGLYVNRRSVVRRRSLKSRRRWKKKCRAGQSDFTTQCISIYTTIYLEGVADSILPWFAKKCTR